MTRRAVMLTPQQDVEARRAFARVFQSDDPRDAPFAPSITHRALWYPVTLGLDLDPRHFESLRAAAGTLGDEEFYVWVPKRNPDAADDPRLRWLVPLSSPDTYADVKYALNFENAHYSPRGTWGLLFSHDDYAVIGGSSAFVDAFFRTLDVRQEESIDAFLEQWSNDRKAMKGPPSWVESLLVHLYGKQARSWLDR